MEDRKQKEKDFHNERERERRCIDEKTYLKRHPNKRFYSITRKSTKYFSDWVRQNCRGKRTLDYCCGLGGVSLTLAKEGAYVYGIDISDESIKTARNNATDAGYAGAINFNVMDAEHMSFEDNFFDAIVCTGVLHHLHLEESYQELARVLKPDGKIICIEPLRYNPVANWYRKRTLHLRTKWEAEHVLTLKDIQKAKAYFGRIDMKFFHLVSIIAVPFRNTLFFKPLLTLLEVIDSIILKIPLVRLMAWQVIFEFKGAQSKIKC